MTFWELFENISYRLRGNEDRMDEEVRGVTAELARVEAGALFVCTCTALRDGHNCVTAAYHAGCRVFLGQHPVDLPDDAVLLTVEDAEALLGELAARFWGYPARSLTVVGITGTFGKTSVAYTLCALLERADRKTALLCSDGVRIGPTLYETGDVVPDAAELQRILRQLCDAGVEVAVLELSAYMLAHKTAFSIPFAVVLLTNLAERHIGPNEFRNFDAYAAAKLSLLHSGAPIVVLPHDLSHLNASSRCLTFGVGGDVFAENASDFVDRSDVGTRFDLVLSDGTKEAVFLPVPGDIAIENALAASAAAVALGATPQQIFKRLSGIRPRGRMECISVYGRRWIFVDAAFEADSLARALQLLRKRTVGRLTVVVGAVGGRARFRRAPLGRTATAFADFAYFTADDPDFEDPAAICAEMTAEADPMRCCTIPDRAAAIRRAVLEMRPGDVLLLAGKGGSRSQLINGIRTPFEERDVVAETVALL